MSARTLVSDAGRQGLRFIGRAAEGFARVAAPHRLNIQQVTPRLWVGGHVPRSDYPALRALGISAVIDAREERSDDEASLDRLGIELLRLPTRDRRGISSGALEVAARWAAPRMAEGRTVLCHCQHGFGRGPLVAMAVLISQGWPRDAAYRAVRSARWQVALNRRQLRALAEFTRASPLPAPGAAPAALRGARRSRTARPA